jgi:hypothetical protein
MSANMRVWIPVAAALPAALAGCASILGIDDVTLDTDASMPGVNGPDSALSPDGGPGVGPGDSATGDEPSMLVGQPEAGLMGPCIDAGLACPSNSSCVPNGATATCACDFGWTGPPSACVNDGPTCAGDSGSCVPFVPTAGVDVADLDGDGLLPVVLTAGGAPDAGPISFDGGSYFPGDTLINVDNGQITSQGVVIRPASTGDLSTRSVAAGIAYRQTSSNLAVITFRSLTIPVGATLKLFGTHAVVIASATTMEIDGVVEARPMDKSGNVCPPTAGIAAPGAGAGGVGCAPIPGPNFQTTPASPGGGLGGGGAANGAGGGGGHAGTGGAGCTTSGCQPGGVAYSALAVDGGPFAGGSGGGGAGCGGSHGTDPGSTGGPGGGAARFVAVQSIEIGGGTTFGGINASGCGGGPGVYVYGPGYTTPAAGGGSGGTIVLEAPRVQLDSNAEILAAGAGGGWYEQNTSLADDGGIPAEPTGYGSSLAIGNLTGAFYALGCPGVQSPGGGNTPSTTTGTAGGLNFFNAECGGGGAAGQIVILAASANAAIAAQVVLSPNKASGATTVGAIQPR